MIVSVIDLGTNTCNLLIAEMGNLDFKILHQSKELVKLGDSNIKTNEIGDEATERVIHAFRVHKAAIKKYDADVTKVIATSAIRSAVNKNEFLEKITAETGLETKVISGEKEAELIFKGVLLAFEKLEQPSIILDIGGGSNELILANRKEILWKESRPSGMGRVINRFDISDPIQLEEINKISRFFLKEHQNGFEKIRELNVSTLIGCSGAFDTVADLIDSVEPGKKQRITQKIELSDFYCIFDRLLKSTRAERMKMKGMDMVRVDLIVPAVVLIEQLISKSGIKRIVQTDFALREGILYEMINKH